MLNVNITHCFMTVTAVQIKTLYSTDDIMKAETILSGEQVTNYLTLLQWHIH